MKKKQTEYCEKCGWELHQCDCDEPKTKIELLRCPFCGGEASLSNNACKQGEKWLWSIECVECECFMTDEYDFHVINRWNTRKLMDKEKE